MSTDEKWIDPNAAQPVRYAARAALIAGLVALVVPNMIQVAEYHSIVTAVIDDLRLLGDHPELLNTTILDVVAWSCFDDHRLSSALAWLHQGSAAGLASDRCRCRHRPCCGICHPCDGSNNHHVAGFSAAPW